MRPRQPRLNLALQITHIRLERVPEIHIAILADIAVLPRLERIGKFPVRRCCQVDYNALPVVRGRVRNFSPFAEPPLLTERTQFPRHPLRFVSAISRMKFPSRAEKCCDYFTMSELVPITAPLMRLYVRLKTTPFGIEQKLSPVMGRCHEANASRSAAYMV